jgi:alkane 1-monooxygenase
MKYFLAYSFPIVALLGVIAGGYFTFSALLFAFGVVPLLEIILPVNEANYSEDEIQSRLANKIYDFSLYLNVVVVYGLIYFVLNGIHARLNYNNANNTLEIIGTIMSLGVVLGSNGINVAHELGHREKLWERILGKMLLIPSHYTHFFIEHNYGHHVHVSTPEDPSTAKYNQNLYAFWWQTVSGTYTKAWEIQKKLNGMNNTKWYGLKNDMFWFTIIQIGYLASIYFVFGKIGLVIAFFAGIVGLLLLETINYIEHYGLMRKKLESGRYERVTEKHSWNSNHVMGRIMLYELTRHSDHHYKAAKKYQVLEYHDVSPQMPFGYPTSMVMSLFPPLWFSIMNKRIPK